MMAQDERGGSPKLISALRLQKRLMGWLLRLNPQDCHRRFIESVESYDY